MKIATYRACRAILNRESRHRSDRSYVASKSSSRISVRRTRHAWLFGLQVHNDDDQHFSLTGIQAAPRSPSRRLSVTASIHCLSSRSARRLVLEGPQNCPSFFRQYQNRCGTLNKRRKTINFKAIYPRRMLSVCDSLGSTDTVGPFCRNGPSQCFNIRECRGFPNRCTRSVLVNAF